MTTKFSRDKVARENKFLKDEERKRLSRLVVIPNMKKGGKL